METVQIQKPSLKIGDVFYTLWGYDQTNYDYVVVIGISPSGKTAICQLAKFDNVGYSGQCNIQKPMSEGFGFKFRLRIENDGEEIRLRGSYPYCFSEVERLGEGEKPSLRRGTFWKAEEEETFYETDSQFGH